MKKLNCCKTAAPVLDEAGEWDKLIEAAFHARENSYSPYSKFRVGAALLCESGEIYTGCNIENRAYGPTNCAERTAVFKAVSEGERDYAAICIVNEDEEGRHGLCPPCGVCRQVLMEFCDPETFLVIVAVSEENYRVRRLKELLPEGFGPFNLNGGRDENSFL